MNKHWNRLADFGTCDASIPWDARGLKTKTVQLPGVSQEEEDSLFQKGLDEKLAELDAREAKLRKDVLSDISKASEKNPRRDVPKVREQREERRTGLRF